ncbi:MAG: VOC family protein [Phycisphaeraceae bacterium]|nr:VOC family protein [Phycisphaeraceae bacterium]
MEGRRPANHSVPPVIEAVHPVLPCREVAKSIAFYEALGFRSSWQDLPVDPKYGTIRRDAAELHLQWADPSQWGHTGDRPVFRFLVRDLDALFREFSARSEITDIKPPFDSSWGTRELHVRDPDGNGLQFYWPR